MKTKEIIELFDNCKENYWQLSADDVAVCLKRVFEYLSKSAKISDEWSFKWSIIGPDVSVYAISGKQSHEYTVGFSRGNFYIESYIFEPKTIKYMSSEFWAILANLDLIESFNFQENNTLSKQTGFDTRTGVSNLYKMTRNYILLEEHEPDSTNDLGALEAYWKTSELSNEILSSAIDVLKGIHKLNYLLYRRDYQRHKGSKA